MLLKYPFQFKNNRKDLFFMNFELKQCELLSSQYRVSWSALRYKGPRFQALEEFTLLEFYCHLFKLMVRRHA